MIITESDFVNHVALADNISPRDDNAGMAEMFHERLKRLRDLRGLTQRGLAELCGWPPSNSRVAQYETPPSDEKNHREPTLDDIADMAAQLGVTPAQLAYGDEVAADLPRLDTLVTALGLAGCKVLMSQPVLGALELLSVYVATNNAGRQLISVAVQTAKNRIGDAKMEQESRSALTTIGDRADAAGGGKSGKRSQKGATALSKRR